MKYENKNKNNWRNKETIKNEVNVGFKKGMLGKFFLKETSRHEQWKGNNHKKDRRNQKKIQKGVDG